MRCIGCGYVLWGLPAGKCPECGLRFDPGDSSTYTTRPPFILWRYWLPGFVFAVGGGLVLYLLLLWLAGWGWAVSLAVPIAFGALVAYGCRVRIALQVFLAVAGLGVVILTLVSMDIAGLFCGTVLAIVALVPTLVGIGLGYALRARLKRSQFEQRSYLPMLMLCAAVVALGLLDRLTHRPYAIESIVTSVEMPATVGRAWNATMFYEEVRLPPPWLLRFGLPRPLYTVGSVAHVGDSKTCVYSKGRLVKRVTGREVDRRLAFNVVEQDHFENHSIRLVDGSFDFTPLGPDLTRVDLTTRYEPKLGPRWVWRPAERLATHTLHRHVLQGMSLEAKGPP